MKKGSHIDRPLAILLASLLFGGCLIFASAAFGLLARGQSNISSIVFNHLALGIGAGLVLLVITASVDHRKWRRFAPYLYALALVATALVFVPHIGSTYLGGRRWLHIAGFTFQPSEALKIGCIMMAAAYFTAMRSKVGTFLYGFGGFIGILALPIVIMVLQPDIGTLGVMCATVFAIYWAAGARISHVGIAICAGFVALLILMSVKPYVRDRVETFFNPSQNQSGQGYQIKQSLIAIGSGHLRPDSHLHFQPRIPPTLVKFIENHTVIEALALCSNRVTCKLLAAE